jgi:hypothetical protein
LEKGSAHPFLAASLFAVLAFEAFVNVLGERIAPQVWADERDRFRGKGAKGSSLISLS